MNGYELSRNWFNFSFDNPEKVKPIHSAIYFFAIEHCNRLGWKQKFGFPSQMVMEAIGVKNWRTYSKGLSDLVDFGFVEMIEVSKNQYSSNIIAIVKNTKAHTKALDKALSKHSTKQCQSTVSIDKQLNNKTNQQGNSNPPTTFNGNQSFSPDNLKIELLKDETWIDFVSMNNSWNREKVENSIGLFTRHLVEQGDEYKTIKDGKSHFINWFRKKFPKEVKATYKRG